MVPQVSSPGTIVSAVSIPFTAIAYKASLIIEAAENLPTESISRVQVKLKISCYFCSRLSFGGLLGLVTLISILLGLEY